MNPLQKQKVSNVKTQGFSLIELMIVVAIIGIITIAAWPSYDRYITKNRRADGITALLEARAKLEKCFINYATDSGYANNLCNPAATSSEGYYAITATNLAAETYTLQATPQGGQTDPECTVLTLTHLGVKGFTNTNVAPDPIGTLARCWSQ